MKIFTNYMILKVMVVFILVNSCSNPGNTINDRFYTELNAQLNSEFFSPVEFSGQFKPNDHSTDWKLIENKIICGDDENGIHLSLDNLSLAERKNNNASSYTIYLYLATGKKTIITSLPEGIRDDQKVNFELNEENVTISITPYEGFFKWDIVSGNDEGIDSIVLEITAPGPYYGGGERYIGTKLNGRTVSNQPNDHYWDPPITEITPWGNPHEPDHYESYEPTYFQLAFYLNPFGSAWLVDDASSVFGTFDEKGEKFKIRIENNRTSFFTIHMPSAKEALTTYTSIVGRQPKIPDWALGVWVNLLDGQDSVLAKAKRLREWDIPATAIWIFDMYDIESSQGWQHWTDGTYHDLRALTDSLHDLEFRVLSYLHPYQEMKMPKTEINNPMYTKLDSMGLLLITPQSIQNDRFGHNKDGLYNFHKPLMGDIWSNMIQMVLTNDNFDGYMEDFGDLSYCFDKKEIKWKAIDYKQETTLTPNQYNNTYPLIYHKLSYLHANEIKPDIATFCRSGSLGSAAFTKILWAGDQIAVWDKTFGYPSAITSGISSGLSGYASWTPDILSDSPDMELWKRWVQFAAFTPIMRDHLWENKPTSIDIWHSSETQKYFKKYTDIHMDLVPYISEHLAEYRNNGIPVIRHMMLEFSNDPETYNCEYQYMFGTRYLVAPVVDQGAVDKKVYLPKGEWKSFWNSTFINSEGQWVIVDAPLHTIPVFERLNFNNND